MVEVEADLHGGVQLEAGEVEHRPAHEVVAAHHVAIVHLATSTTLSSHLSEMFDEAYLSRKVFECDYKELRPCQTHLR